jgi:asparagine synthase (glutamine-hydrolysing)
VSPDSISAIGRRLRAEVIGTGAHGRRFGHLRRSYHQARAALGAPPVARQVRQDGLTLLSLSALSDLWAVASDMDEREVPGSVIEAGCARGGSAIVLASAKSAGRPLALYDTFGLIPPPSSVDGEGVEARYAAIVEGRAAGVGDRPYYGYVPNLEAEVLASFSEYALDENMVTTYKGRYEDTLRPDGAVSLAHIDCDWYESVKVCLDRIAPALSPGGVMVIDDYETWEGCAVAVDEFLATTSLPFKVRWRSRLHLVRS